MEFRRIQDIDLKNKTVLYRADLNVPMQSGKVKDTTRISRLLPTINELLKNNCKIVIISHFGRPKGAFNRDLSLAPIADALSSELNGKTIHFAIDCIGKHAEEKINETSNGEIILMENLRFHKEEEENDPDFVKKLSKLADIYINDAFSCSHREHASISGVAHKLTAAAGLLLENEIIHLSKILQNPKKPMLAIVGGSKVSTKLSVLQSLIERTQYLVIGGAMANTFIKAQGQNIGNSLHEKNLVEKAKQLLESAKKHGCEIIIPHDVVVTQSIEKNTKSQIIAVNNIKEKDCIVDIGPDTIQHIHQKLKLAKTIIWNGPLGVFEIAPFDIGTISVARIIASVTQTNKTISIAGGGDVVAAINKAGLYDEFSYISTAGGAFLEWLEGKKLPGITPLRTDLGKLAETA